MSKNTKKTILLVEDDALIAMMEKLSLEGYGYDVITAETGEAGIEAFRNNTAIELILMDIDLGKGIDGPTAAIEILKEREIPVVFLSSHTEPEVVEKTEKITSYGYVVKNSGITVLDASMKMAFKLFEAKQKEQKAKKLVEIRLNLIEYLVNHTLDELLTKTLDIAGELVQSPIGFYHFLSQDQKTLSLQQWSSKTLSEFCTADGKGSHYPVGQAGVWVDCIHQRGPVVHNDNESLPNKKGLPEGHAPVIRELVVPVIRKGSIVGILGVGNKSVDYTQDDVETVTHLADMTWQIIEQKRAEEALDTEYRLREMLLDNIPNCIAMILKKGTREIVSSNKYAREIGAVPGATCYGTCAKRDSNCNFCLAPVVWENDIPQRLEVEENGVWYEGIWMPLNDELYVHYIYDITERKQAEKILLDERNMFIGGPAVIFKWIAAEGWPVEYVSPNVSAQFGYSVEDFTSRKILFGDIVHKDDLERVGNEVQKCSELGTLSFEQEYRIKHADGEYRWLYDFTTVKRNDLGKITNYQGYVLDITERKRVEESLKISEDTFHRIVNTAQEGIWLLDTDAKTSYVNPCMTEMIGYSAKEMLGSSLFDFMDDEARREAETLLERRRQGVSEHHEFRFRRKDGSILWAVVGTNAILDNSGKFIGALGMIMDITERKRVEEELKQSEERLRLSLYAANQGLYDLNVQTGAAIVNDEYALMLGYDPRTFAETNSAWIERLHPDDHDITAKAYSEYIKGLTTEYRVEFRQRTIDSQWKWILSLGKIVEYDTDGKPLRMLGTHTDITDRKQAEEKINKLLSEKELILKEVHHRIKNNMSTIISLLTLQTRTLKDPIAVSSLNDAGSRIKSMMVLYDKLYLAQNFNEMPASNYLFPLVDEIVMNFPNSGSVRIEKDIDEFILDSKRLSTIGIIVNELLTNIMKYAFVDKIDGVITVSASLKGNLVCITIQDNGIGMPESINSESQSGFGMMLVNILVKQLKGTWRIERDNGSRVVLEFEK